MRTEYTKEEMMALWKRRHFIEPLRADCVMSRSDGVDMDTRVAEDMRAWYLDLLRNAPVEHLAPTDMSLTCSVSRDSAGALQIRLPASAVRVAAVKLSGWERAVVPVVNAGSACRQGNKYACGGVANPQAVLEHGGILRLSAAPGRLTLPAIEVLDVITDPGPELYVMDESAVALIGTDLICDNNGQT